MDEDGTCQNHLQNNVSPPLQTGWPVSFGAELVLAQEKAIASCAYKKITRNFQGGTVSGRDLTRTKEKFLRSRFGSVSLK